MKINYFDKRIQFKFFFKEGTKYTYNHGNVPHNKHRTTKLHAKSHCDNPKYSRYQEKI